MGVLGVFAGSVTLINRTTRNLGVRYDGEDIVIKPGENPGFPKEAVPFARKQNPLMGSRHPVDPRRYTSLVGVKDTKDDCSPIPEAVIRTGEATLELVDRSGKVHGIKGRKVKVLNQGFTSYEAEFPMAGEYDVNKAIE